MAFFASRIQDVKNALRRLRKGGKPTTQNEEDFAWLERTIGLKKPLREYSERSQRRYFQGLREGASSAKEVHAREYAARKAAKETAMEEHSMLPSQWKRIEPLRDKLATYGMDVDPYMDDDVLKDFAEIYGYAYLHRVLTNQLDSTERYLAGNSEPGNRRWHARGQLESQFGISSHVIYIRDTNPYYYYHGRKA